MAADDPIARLTLTTHASVTAKSAFRAVGFSVVEDEIVQVRGESLKRFKMAKELIIGVPN